MKRSDECWLWQGYRMKFGYGLIQARKVCSTPLLAHRVAYELTNGPIPKGKHVLHRCDNPPCVNPEHLFIGTQQDNNLDRDRKGRTASGDKNGARTNPMNNPFVRNHGSGLVGEQHPRSKLTDVQIQNLRNESESGIRQIELSKKYGITSTHVSRIVRGVMR